MSDPDDEKEDSYAQRIETIADAMSAYFGDRALAVAELQAAQALTLPDEKSALWSNIVSVIQRKSIPPLG